jgi:hypothetical protein
MKWSPANEKVERQMKEKLEGNNNGESEGN